MPIPGPERPLESLGSPKTGKDTQKPVERVLRDSTGISQAVSGILSGVVPEKHLPMAVESFKKRFPDVADIKQVKGTEFFDWVDTLPLVSTAREITIA